MFGITFTINLMESGEHDAIETYARIGKEVPVVLEVMEDEVRHEVECLSYISSMIFGLNDALMELTGLWSALPWR